MYRALDTPLVMKWITREHVHVDRVACPWLIRRFVDPSAEFIFVPAGDVERIAQESKAIPFDTPGAELGHREERCSFDAIIEKYDLKDQALLDLAAIVRAADTDAFHLAPESIGLEAIAAGATMISKDDSETIEKSMFLYDSLYANCELRLLREKYKAELEKMSRVERRDFLKRKLSEKARNK